MTMSKHFIGSRRQIAFWCITAVLAFGPVSASGAAEGLQVPIDQTVPVKLDRAAATVVVGNPAIADIAAQSSKLFFIVGRTMGTTNVVAIDAAGDQITNVTIHVTSGDLGQVALHRSTLRESYTCAPICDRAQIPGDEFISYKNLVQANKEKMNIAKQGREASN